jgi:SAM-dependent MidA family methyltransferase
MTWELVDFAARSDATDAPANVVLANEYLDALPVHRLVREAGVLHEAWVTWRDGWFAQALGELSSAALPAHLDADGVALVEGQWADVCLAAAPALTAMADGLAPGGILLIIDYGHDAGELHAPRRMAGSLLTYRDHRVTDDPFASVGRADMTAHVDLTALARAATAAGLVQAGRTTQARFLADLGLGALLSDIGRDPTTPVADYVEARATVARLLDPRHLGAFAVLAWRRPADRSGGSLAGAGEGAVLPGFRSS